MNRAAGERVAGGSGEVEHSNKCRGKVKVKGKGKGGGKGKDGNVKGG